MGNAAAGVVASLEVVAGLGQAAQATNVVTAEHAASVFLSWLGAPDVRWVVAPGFGASGEGVPDEVEDEVDATLRLAERALGRSGITWDDRIRVALGRALAAAAQGDIRYVGFKLVLRSLLAECDSPGEYMEFVRRFHLRPDEEFLADGVPVGAVGLDRLRSLGLVEGPDLGIKAKVPRTSLLAALRGTPKPSPLEQTLTAEAGWQAARSGGTHPGQGHLIMALAAVEWAAERTGSRFADPVANGAGRALAAHGLTYPRVRHHATMVPEDLSATFTEAARLATDLAVPAPGTTHLLYVIAADGDSPGARMLRDHGVDPGAVAVHLGRDLAG